MLGVIIAMDTECINLVKTSFDDIFIHNIGNQKFYVIKTLSGKSVVITFSGIGKVNSANATSLMINSFKIKQCLNIGSAGIYSGINVKDIIVVDTTMYCDVDVTGFGYEINQVPKMPIEYKTNENMNNVIIEILNSSNYIYKLGNCLTSDSFINKKNIGMFHIQKTQIPIVLDMECSAIAQVCFKHNIEFSAIKIGIDKLDNPEKNELQFSLNLNDVANILDNVSKNCIEAISYKLY